MGHLHCVLQDISLQQTSPQGCLLSEYFRNQRVIVCEGSFQYCLNSDTPKFSKRSRSFSTFRCFSFCKCVILDPSKTFIDVSASAMKLSRTPSRSVSCPIAELFQELTFCFFPIHTSLFFKVWATLFFFGHKPPFTKKTQKFKPLKVFFRAVTVSIYFCLNHICKTVLL